MSNRQTHLAHPPHKSDEASAPDHSGGVIAIMQVQPFMGTGVVVTSPAVGTDGRIDPVFSQGGDDVSPELVWNPVEEAQAWAVIVQDPDAPQADPVTHWAVWDLPGPAVGVAQNVEKVARPTTPQDAIQGLNGQGAHGWMGPKPPPGHGVHRYHFQVFALAKPLGLDPSTPLVELISALKGNTVASGELVGTFETPDAQDLDSPGRTGSYGASPETA